MNKINEIMTRKRRRKDKQNSVLKMQMNWQGFSYTNQEKTQIDKILHERGNITTDTTEIQF
jgi:hypothetical protein